VREPGSLMNTSRTPPMLPLRIGSTPIRDIPNRTARWFAGRTTKRKIIVTMRCFSRYVERLLIIASNGQVIEPQSPDAKIMSGGALIRVVLDQRKTDQMYIPNHHFSAVSSYLCRIQRSAASSRKENVCVEGVEGDSILFRTQFCL
jgi:hypothetical protein